ncbi:HU family DNA-binding protein [Hoeflea olei]|uniref:DNA-binding protein n=1 Tax=Hoeflea olei TaxID=1480615 RepID=A0A1C1YTJ4_9HYPH|nr:HU family DNA-binding protein [Hoeflea olei]OCW56707.1 hypothetical protein AWJ14_17415 [Hoeflea olei]
MNKKELIAEVARKTGMSRRDAAIVVDSLLETIGRQMSDGDEVVIRDFGKFARKQRKPQTGRNPRTGQTIEIPARAVLKFTPSPALLSAINGGRTSDP